MALTKHQEDVLKQSIEILKKENRLLIKGSAGVGKTYMVNELIKQAKKLFVGNKSIYCSAPTNKAVAVLKDKVDEIDNLFFITTHSALKLKRKIHYKTGNITFKPSFDTNNPPLNGVKLLVIDETSMLNTELLNYVEEHANEQHCKVIFIGDDKQLNPVKEKLSPVFLRNYPEVELLEIIRQGEGNPIIDLSRNLSNIKNKIDKRNEVGGYIYSNDIDKVVNTLALVNGTDELKYLAFTNKEVNRINKLVRNKIYGEPAKIELGETLVFNSPYNDEYFTNQEVLVNKLMVRKGKFKYMHNKRGKEEPGPNDEPMYKNIELMYYSINYMEQKPNEFSNGGLFNNIIVIHEKSEKKYNELLKLLKEKIKFADLDWKEYYQFIEQFADMNYNHAITIHKSQGSSYKQAIINIRDVNINRSESEKQRLLYTGITRASELLILYNV